MVVETIANGEDKGARPLESEVPGGLNAVSPDDFGRKGASSPKLRIFEAGIRPG
jgi:hypothetical protein